jgi:NLR family CARD domain-containing protein 3
MFVKYNGCLRALGGKMKWMVDSFMALCLGNKYVTTLHCINSALLKMSKIQRAEVVYRGSSGGVLPSEFWQANELNVKGGIEFGFMSTTLNREVAMHYASAGRNSIVLEMQMGMIDRGAASGNDSIQPVLQLGQRG